MGLHSDYTVIIVQIEAKVNTQFLTNILHQTWNGRFHSWVCCSLGVVGKQPRYSPISERG